MADDTLFSSVEGRRRRSRLAEALMMQGIDTSPVQHWTQGLARIAQAMAGGYFAGELDREERDRLKRAADILKSAPGLAPQTEAPVNVGQTAEKFAASAAPLVNAPVTPVKETPIPSVGQRAAAWTGYTPSTWDEYRQPLRNAPVVTSPYGERTHPILGRRMMHEGVDLAAAPDTPVYASAPGRIVKMGEDAINGKFVVIQHNDGKTTSYSHLSGFGPFKEGDTITDPTNEIGYVGSTGRATGPHLHFGTRNQAGASSDPQTLLGQTASPNAAGPRIQPAAMPPPPPAQPPSHAAPRATAAIPQAQADYIRALIDSNEPELVRLGMQLYAQFTKPGEYGFQVVGDQLYRTDKRAGTATPIAGVTKPEKPPAGYRWSADGRSLEPIPGGPATQVSGEQAGRIALAQNALAAMPQIRATLLREWTPEELWQAQLNMGTIGRAQRDVRTAIEAGLRMMTGAAAPESEVRQYLDLFMPKSTDSIATRKQKLDNLENFMRRTVELSPAGRGTMPNVNAPAGGWINVTPTVRMRRID